MAAEQVADRRYEILDMADSVAISVLGQLSDSNLEKLRFFPAAALMTGYMKTMTAPYDEHKGREPLIERSCSVYYNGAIIYMKTNAVRADNKDDVRPASLFIGDKRSMGLNLPPLVENMRQLGIRNDPYVSDLDDAIEELNASTDRMRPSNF